jgi:DNA-binding transcriptional LysR family regulator
MLNLDDLEQLIAFYELGTLSKVADKYHISVSSITRSMKRLEETIGVELFDREINKIKLNSTGEKTVELGKELIDSEQEFIRKIKAMDKHSKTIYLKSCELGALFEAENWITKNYPNKSISSSLLTDQEIIYELENGICDIGILSYPIESAIPLVEEKLFISVKKSHPLAKQETVSFSQLNGLDFLCLKNVGYWETLKKSKLPNSRFFVQEDLESYVGLIQVSDIPTFSPSKEMLPFEIYKNRVEIPINDEEAKHTFYIVDNLHKKIRT